MHRRSWLLGALMSLLVAQASGISVRAQSTPQSQQAALAPIKQAIIVTTGYDAASVELTASAVTVFVTVVNSKLTGASGLAREAEASRIVATITRAIAGNAEFRTVQAIHVDYVSRESDGGHSRTVDAIDFRRNPQGNFEHHIT